MKLSAEYKVVLKNLFETCENYKNYIFNYVILDYKKFTELDKAYETANGTFEKFDKNLRFED